MHPILARALAAGSALAALAVAVVISAPGAGAAPRTVAVRHVVLIGVPGLRWTDVSAAATPALWRLARQGSVGSLSVTGIHPVSCPADGWLTLNSGARAAAPRTAAGSCAPLAQVAQMRGIVSFNQPYNENPAWGMLRSAAGPAGCTNAVGPVPLSPWPAGPARWVPSCLTRLDLTQADLARCPLTVRSIWAAQVRAADGEIGRIAAMLPARTILVVAGISDDGTPHLRLLVVSGPGFRSGLVTSPSTRQRGLALLTDVPVSVLHWLGRPVPSGAVGQVLHRASRSSLAVAVSGLIGQDTAAQVYRETLPGSSSSSGSATWPCSC